MVETVMVNSSRHLFDQSCSNRFIYRLQQPVLWALCIQSSQQSKCKLSPDDRGYGHSLVAMA